MKLTQILLKIERRLGSLKFAVVIILLFALASFYGTLMESYHGREYADRHVYKSVIFMLIQFFMFCSIVAATFLRLPFKKRLYGFYVIHLGLVILFVGSVITYIIGIDGQLTLAPNEGSNLVRLNDDELTIRNTTKGKQAKITLPNWATANKINENWENIKLKRYYPYAEIKTQWKDFLKNPRFQSTSYRIANENFGENITLSLHPKSDYENSQKLGPLTAHYMPLSTKDCFLGNTTHQILLFDARKGICLNVPDKHVYQEQERTIVRTHFDRKKLLFYPDLSPLPMDEQDQSISNSPYRIFSRNLFKDSPHIFLFGQWVSYFDQESEKWLVKEITPQNAVELPWMGFQIKVIKHEDDAYPINAPVAVTPIQEEGKLIQGDVRAIEIEIDGESFWVTNQNGMQFNSSQGDIELFLTKETLPLNFEIILERFQMNTDPGTNNPASYESFVSVFAGTQGAQKHHIYMNNPLKFKAFTFYQASYFETNQGYGSVLSVNYDPGRPWKYLGSFLIVLGSIWHFILRRKKGPNESTRPSKEQSKASYA